jgi:hypothetical protein
MPFYWHKKKAKKKTKKRNPTDINLLAREVVEAAIGENLSPPKHGKRSLKK